ncbi:MAG TPA: tRNA (adenosine(37)-N6)-threonylcarbamoyltransferase complex ATPase subunit type 1 TsaE [Gammaproteobacteria bacterium]|nr:tRNA (adenosine(37)-N6)-threonylcarbamoyltransferase complex ATPase subunit type 1 TsaE [Gammaproteobacteria bacterium]
MLANLKDSAATESAGAALAEVLPEADMVIYLRGELGAGKTTLVRGVLRALGHRGRVPSPSYTLVEPYELPGRSLQHLDLYRIGDPGELSFLGVRDLSGTLFVEWPERGEGRLPAADLICRLSLEGGGRRLEAEAGSPRGEELKHKWSQRLQTQGIVGL